MVRDLLRRRPGVPAIILWVPVRPDDTLATAEAEASLLTGEHVMHLWDGDREVSDRFARRLSLAGPGWDLYLLYQAGARWDAELPPAPAFWMHQLSPDTGADPALYLCRDPARLEVALDGLL